ncbi:MAG: sigma 54-interacting transcriptional regulator [Deltaproteobacteria bacterium]|nr:sigma 54-interacting transcriptional regulator [Deltaproteobacteria bacterium]
MRQIFEFCVKFAASDATVLIAGESGTGKELVAHTIHRMSPRAAEAFVPVNCAAIPEELLESELFGHVRGAFTGAMNSRQGRFQLAHAGTLFLDEIGEMSPKLQVKLLRVLQEREFEPVGSDKSVKVDVRVIAATNRELSQAVRERRFREDLYYRLNVLPVCLPPLRERRGDIPLLITHFLRHHGQRKGKCLESIEEEALRRLEEYHWPGNVRELENFVERLVVLNEDGVIRCRDILDYIQSGSSGGEEPVFVEELSLPPEGMDLDGFLREIENKLILDALKRARGNKTLAAELLRLNRTTLVERLRKRGLLLHRGNGMDAASGNAFVRNVTPRDFSLTAS